MCPSSLHRYKHAYIDVVNLLVKQGMLPFWHQFVGESSPSSSQPYLIDLGWLKTFYFPFWRNAKKIYCRKTDMGKMKLRRVPQDGVRQEVEIWSITSSCFVTPLSWPANGQITLHAILKRLYKFKIVNPISEWEGGRQGGLAYSFPIKLPRSG